MRNEITGGPVIGAVLHCTCGAQYHVSAFREILEDIARSAIRYARMNDDDFVQEAIQRGYDIASASERMHRQILERVKEMEAERGAQAEL